MASTTAGYNSTASWEPQRGTAAWARESQENVLFGPMQTDGSPREKVQSGKCVWRVGARYITSPHLLGQPEIEETRLLACARFTATPSFQSGACKLPLHTGCETTTALSNKLPVVKSLTNCVNKKNKSRWICQNPLQTYDPINKNPVKITMVATPDSHSRTKGVMIVLQSGCRLPATIVHGSRHLNGKDHIGLPRLSGT